MNPHLAHPAGLAELFASFWRNRKLIVQLTRRDVVGRYRGSLIGLAWSFFNPLLMLIIYTFVFSVIFKARWNSGQDDTHSGFAVVLFAGIIIHGLFAECFNKAPSLILNNVSYVKRVVFPLEILPWVSLGGALFHMAISLLVLLATQLCLGYPLHWTALLFPIVVLPMVGVLMGLSWLLASTSVYVRDLAQLTGIMTSVLMFLAPIFYPASAIPEQYRGWLYLNPLTLIVEQARMVLIAGKLPDWGSLAIYSVISLAFAMVGFWWFQKSRKGFADVV